MNSAVGYRIGNVLRVAVAVALFASLLPGGFPAPAQAQQNCRKMNNFDVCGRFLEEWNKHGGDQANLYVSGFPLTPRRAEVSLTNGSIYEMQWFERTRFEAHTANAAPYDVLLGLLGTSLAEGRGSVNPSTGKLRNQSDLPFAGIARPGDTGPNKVWFPETRHTISGKIMEYWNRYGGLKQFGFPLSEPFEEVSQADGKPYMVQYFQRNRFELHPEKAAPYEVELGLLGVEQYRATPIMADQLPIAPPKGTATANDTLTIAVSREPASLFPLFESASVAHLVSEPIFDMLVNRDARDNLFPEIAWYVPTIENGGAFFTGTGADRHLVVKYKMRPGIKWSDGAEVTSRDALYHFKLVMDPNALVQDRTSQEMVADVGAPDKYTVIYNFMSPAQARDFYNKTLEKEHFAHLKAFADANLPVIDPLYSLVGGLLPEHILGKIQADRILDTPFARNPVGSGPFKVERFDAGSQIVLIQNPNYNLTDKPLLKKIIIKIIPDLTQVVAQLRSGDLDAATSDLFSMPIQALDTIGGYQKVEYAPNRVWERIDFNLDRPFFQDKAVRQAITLSINRQQIVEKVMLGKAPVLHTPITAASWASLQNPDFARGWESKFPLKKYDYDLAKANQMLDGAGWVKGPDGIRAKGNTRLSFTYATQAGNRAREQISQLIVADLKAVGIEATVKMLNSGDQSYLTKREHDLIQYTSIMDIDPSGAEYNAVNIPTTENNFNGANYSGWRNTRFDELSRADDKEIDRTKRAPLLAEMQSIWSEELPTIPLYPRVTIEVRRTNLVGWEASGGATPSTYKVGAMYFR